MTLLLKNCIKEQKWISDSDSFIVLGKEENRGASHEFLMNVHFTNDKIDAYTYKYLAQN